MKKLLSVIIITGVLLQAGINVRAQSTAVKSQKHSPKWVSNLGYWVIESKISKPGVSVIYYYRKDNQLVYKETLHGISFNTKRRKVKMKLKETLERSIENFEQIAWKGEMK